MSDEVTAARQELADAESALTTAAAARERATTMDARITAEASELQRRRELLSEEQKDVDQLSGMSLTRILATLTGTRERRNSAEAAERDAAALEVATREAALKRLQADADWFHSQAGSEVEMRTRAERARTTYVGALERAGDPRGRRGLQLIKEIAQLQAGLIEITEAQQAAEAARVALREAAEALSSAGAWSTYDTFFGGGMIADAIKHDRLDTSARAIERVHYALTVLATELRDVPGELDAGPEAPQISGTLKTMDFWFDNIFSDWMVRDRISASRESVARTGENLAYVESSLASALQTKTTQLDQDEVELVHIVAT